MVTRTVAISAVMLALLSATVRADTMEKELATLKDKVCKQLQAKGCKKVAALDFTDLQERRNELGRYLSEQLTVDMVGTDGLAVLDRANLKSILDEHKLTEAGLVKPENAKALGQFSGVDAIIIGNVTTLDSQVVLVVKAISTENAEIVAAGTCKIDKSPDVVALLGNGIVRDVVAGGNSGSGTVGPTVSDSPKAIATKNIGALHIILKDVATLKQPAQTGEYTYTNAPTPGQVVGVVCSFEFVNVDLQKALKVARNSATVNNQGTRAIVNLSTLTDSDGHTWKCSSATGIPRVVCGENGSPESIVKYIQSGEYVEGEGSLPTGFTYSNTGQQPNHPTAWAGDFAEIGTGKTSQISMTFAMHDQYGQQLGAKTLDSFRFECQLVVGIVDPSTKKFSYTLETVVFDKVTMPTIQAKP